MSNVTYSADTVNRPLTDFAVGLWPELTKGTIAEFVAPTVPVQSTDGEYAQFDTGIPFDRVNTQIDDDADLPQVKFNGTRAKFNIRPHGLQIPISDFAHHRSGSAADVYEQAKIKNMLSQQLIAREFAVADMVAKSTRVADGATYGTWKGTAGAQADIIGQLDDLIVKVTTDCGGGIMPNKMVIPLGLWVLIKNHPSVRERLAGIKSAAALSEFAGMLANPAIDIRIGSICYNAGKPGRAKAMTPIYNSSILLFHGEDTPTTEDFSFMKTFMLDDANFNANGTVHTVRNKLNNGDIHYVQWAQDVRETASHAGIVVNVK
ncbi:MAG: hypothetical protein IJB33_08495 [Akkermansia sp.]|nr:hypothetical protein [Akkermansia sp.]MBQ7023659.1 hypothetical protein [Akkermansia sp.]